MNIRRECDSIEKRLNMDKHALNYENIEKYFRFQSEVDQIINGVESFLEDHKEWFDDYPLLVNPYAFALAVRHQESGRTGLEFGVMNQAARVDLRTQLLWFMYTLRNDTKRYYDDTLINVGGRKRDDFGNDFLSYFAAKYCPIGAANDPTNLNIHWEPNVRRFYSLYKQK